jgi:hypothetical protein
MTNIWANTFEDVRKPHFEMEDPYTSLQEKKEGKKVKKWWDDDGDGVGYEEGEVSGKFSKKKNKKKVEEETLYTSKSSQEKIKERKDIRNKINTKPTTSEEVETWVAELVAEGYDLSEFTWEEMTDIYLDEAGGSSAMPPRGDYQTTTATATQKQDPNAPLIAAKAKAAKAKVTKEIADLQVAKQSQRMKVDTNESVIHYLAHRPDPFENLDEAVFDPKKSKMRPASERSQNAMTDAKRKAAKTEQDRVTAIHSKGETVLAGLTSSGRKGKVDTAPKPKPAAPTANRKVTGKYDNLAKKASDILKSAKDK